MSRYTAFDIDGLLPFKSLADIANKFTGNNINDLASRYGYSLVDMHKIIFARRPADYSRSKCGRVSIDTNAQGSVLTTGSPLQSTSALPGHVRSFRRTAGTAGRHTHSDNSKNNGRLARSFHAATKTMQEPQIHCSVRIDVDSLDQGRLSVTLANGQALELTLTSGAHNADTHRSCRG